jgi:KUP system potassium uptake protein
MVACIGLVLGFRSSSNLAAAYGVAVTVTMGVTSILFFFAAQRLWGWKWWQAAAVCAIPLVIESAFSVANLLKIQDGGWFPLVLALGIFVLMSTWKTGRTQLWRRVRDASMPAGAFINDITSKPRDRVSGTAVYMAGNSDGTPIALLHNLKHNKVLHKRIVFLTVITEEDPRVEPSERIEVEKLEGGFWRVKLHYGFMEEPDVMSALGECADRGLEFRAQETTFFVSRETIISSRKSGMAAWREKLFAIMARNASSATAFFRLPPTGSLSSACRWRSD